MHVLHKLHHFSREFLRAIGRGKFSRESDGGIILLGSARLHGVYREGIMGKPESFLSHSNLIPDAGILHVLNVVFGSTAKATAWYIAPYSGNTSPVASLTASNFTSTQTEITSGTEGYSEVARQQCVMGAAAAGVINNSASLASFSIVTASALTIRGAGLLSNSGKGSTSGVLASCAAYGTPRVLNSGDTWQARYDVTLADT